MIEVRLAISPTPSFVNQVRLLAASLREFYDDARVRVWVGTPGGYMGATAAEKTLLQPLSDDEIKVQWVSAQRFNAWAGTRSPYLATMNARFAPITDPDVSHVIIADADVLVMRPFRELFREDAVQGVMTHVPPMPRSNMQALWQHFTGIGGWPLYPHSGAGIMCAEDERSEWYVNSGFVFFPRRLFEEMIDPYHEAIGMLRRVLTDSYWFDQLALGLATTAAAVAVEALPLRFNFPNDPRFDAAQPGELDAVRVLHYLRTDIVDRTRDFADSAAVRRLIARCDLSGSNEALRLRVAKLAPGVFPQVAAHEYSVETAPYA